MAQHRSSIIRFASIIALVGNLLLAILKICAGLYSDSFAVVGDGIDSAMDVLIAIMTLLVARVVSKPADKDHPWGHGRAETVATSILSMVLFFAGGQLIISSLLKLLSGTSSIIPNNIAIIVTVISIVGKALLSWNQYSLGKKASSEMLKANAKNMFADILTSVGVLIGLAFTKLFNIGAIDTIVAILVGLWIIKNAIGIFLETNMELMDGNNNDKYYKILFEAVKSVPNVFNPHRVRMRRIAGFWDIDLDIEVDKDLTVAQAHEIANQVENAIKGKIDQVFDIVVHIEPKGNRQTEGYGLMEKLL